jgi:hypothetical protein
LTVFVTLPAQVECAPGTKLLSGGNDKIAPFQAALTAAADEYMNF